MKNYYTVLGVSSNATQAEIKHAYRRLAIAYHPDKNPDPAAEHLIKEVNEAYDVLGDRLKRSAYDYSIQSPFVAPAPIQPEEPKPFHRDPAYRRRRSSNQPRPSRPSSLDLKRQYLPYFKWLIFAGLGIMLLFIVDFFLPHESATERIVEMYSEIGPKNLSQDVLHTNTQRSIVMSPVDSRLFSDNDEIIVVYTPILKAVQEVTNLSNGHCISLGGIYGPVIIFPLVMFAISIMGFIYRKNVEYAFSVSVVNGILIILTLYLIFNT